MVNTSVRYTKLSNLKKSKIDPLNQTFVVIKDSIKDSKIVWKKPDSKKLRH